MKSRRSMVESETVTLYLSEAWLGGQSSTHVASELFYTDEACNGAKTSGKWRHKVIDGNGVQYRYW